MNQQGDERNGWARRSSLFSHGGARRRDNETLDNETLTDDRLADLAGSLDSIHADPAADTESQRADVEAAGRAEPEAEEESAKSAPTVADPDAQDESVSTAQLAGDPDAAGVDSAARVLALAQKLHDEYVAEGRSAGDKLRHEGQTKYDELVSAGQAHHDALVAEADAAVVEAQQKSAEVLQGLDTRRSQLQQEIEELRSFESDLRASLRSYLERGLVSLEQTGTDETG